MLTKPSPKLLPPSNTTSLDSASLSLLLCRGPLQQKECIDNRLPTCDNVVSMFCPDYFAWRALSTHLLACIHCTNTDSANPPACCCLQEELQATCTAMQVAEEKAAALQADLERAPIEAAAAANQKVGPLPFCWNLSSPCLHRGQSNGVRTAYASDMCIYCMQTLCETC